MARIALRRAEERLARQTPSAISAEKAITENIDIVSRENVLEQENRRVLVEDVDEGEILREKVHDLKQLVIAYQLGWIKEAESQDRVW